MKRAFACVIGGMASSSRSNMEMCRVAGVVSLVLLLGSDQVQAVRSQSDASLRETQAMKA